MDIGFQIFWFEKYRQKYRHFSQCPRSTPRQLVDPAHFGQLGIQRLGQLPQLRPVSALPGIA